MHGYVVRLRTDRGFGFIREGKKGGNGAEYFFHRRDCDVMSPFDRLQVDDQVSFEGSAGPKGLRAELVSLA